MASHSEARQQRNTVDYNNVILALPAHFPALRKKKAPRVDGKKGETTSEETPTGFAKNRCNVNDEHAIEEDYTGQRRGFPVSAPGLEPGLPSEQQNSTNTEEILEESAGLGKEPNVANNENLILEEQSGKQNLAHAKEDIVAEDPAAEEPNAMNDNEQPILEEPTGLVQQQNPANAAQGEMQEEDPAGLVQQLNLENAAHGEMQEEDPAGLVQQQDPANAAQQGEVQAEDPAGLVEQQNPANAGQGEMEAEDPAVMADIVEYALRNPIVEDIDDIIKDLDDNY